MAIINDINEYKLAVFNICELLQCKDSRVDDCYSALIAAEKDADFITPIGFIVDAFSLSDKEGLALCVCAKSLWLHNPLPTLSEIIELCSLFGKNPHHIFSAQHDGKTLSEAVRGFIMDAEIATYPCVQLHLPTDAELFHSHSVLNELQTFCAGFSKSQDGCSAAVVLTGKKGVGKTFLLTRLAQLNNGTLLVVDAASALPEYAAEIAITATLYRSIVCVKNKNSGQDFVKSLYKRLSLLFFVDDKDATVPNENTVLLKLEIEGLTALQRGNAIEKLFELPNDSMAVKTAYIIYNATIGNLVNAKLRYAAEVIAGRVTQGDETAILQIIKDSCTANLGDNANKTVTNKRLCDVVLPASQHRQLNEICSFIKNKKTVYEQWNFNEKIPYGRGITMLFYGSSGTGKTLAATAMANELSLDLYRVDLSRLISKYIGETQKNIGKIFDDAQNSDCILFFDEADALFSKRSDGQDSQDKHSNAEIAYLLQRTEHYDGAIILATNLLQNFDEAFRRRIDYMIHFPLPDESLRQKLWEDIFPKEAPTEDINTGLLAKHIELSGAGIRNCAVNAALIAASEGSTITMARVIRAAEAEYQKQNKQFPVQVAAMYR